MRKKHAELYSGDIIVFNKSTGAGFIVEIENKGVYFTPAKKGMQLKGNTSIVENNEYFIYNGYKLLSTKGADRLIRINLTRLSTNQLCYITEFDMHKYFAKPERLPSNIESHNKAIEAQVSNSL